MNPLVYFQVVRLRESLLTIFAGIWFLPSMDPLVYSGEGPPDGHGFEQGHPEGMREAGVEVDKFLPYSYAIIYNESKGNGLGWR